MYIRKLLCSIKPILFHTVTLRTYLTPFLTYFTCLTPDVIFSDFWWSFLSWTTPWPWKCPWTGGNTRSLWLVLSTHGGNVQPFHVLTLWWYFPPVVTALFSVHEIREAPQIKGWVFFFSFLGFSFFFFLQLSYQVRFPPPFTPLSVGPVCAPSCC